MLVEKYCKNCVSFWCCFEDEPPEEEFEFERCFEKVPEGKTINTLYIDEGEM